MNKIPISKISQKVFSQKGFGSKGCYGCSCKDECCRFGADVDKEAYDLILKYRADIEKIIKIKIENCFENEWSGDKELLGKNSIRTKIGKNNFCVFHLSNKKGCALFELSKNKKLPKRIIPSICRLYPLNWNNGEIVLDDDIELHCNCLNIMNKTQKSIFENQKEHIEDIFKIKKNCFMK